MRKLLVSCAAILLALLLSACGGGAADDPPPPAGLPELEETAWQAVSTDAGDFGLSGGYLDNPRFAYVFEHTGTVPLDQLIAFSLVADGFGEGASEELRSRFLEAPHTVLAYLVLMGDQTTQLPGWEPMSTAEIICRFIAAADTAWYGGSEEFGRVMAACREAYSGGRAAELLDVLEAEHTAGMERNNG